MDISSITNIQRSLNFTERIINILQWLSIVGILTGIVNFILYLPLGYFFLPWWTIIAFCAMFIAMTILGVQKSHINTARINIDGKITIIKAEVTLFDIENIESKLNLSNKNKEEKLRIITEALDTLQQVLKANSFLEIFNKKKVKIPEVVKTVVPQNTLNLIHQYEEGEISVVYMHHHVSGVKEIFKKLYT